MVKIQPKELLEASHLPGWSRALQETHKSFYLLQLAIHT